MKTDIQLQRDVIDELRWDASLAGAEIGVAAKDGVVTLSGEVDSYARKLSAARAAERVRGVRVVADTMTVTLPLESKKSDTEIAHAVAAALHWDVLIPEEQVKVRVDDGWLWLEGTVDWQYQRNAVSRAVRNLTGVRGVTNLIMISPRASAPDVKHRIEDALKRQAEVDAHEIRVEAVGGKVTLKGRVRSSVERLDAERAAWSAPGVFLVEDEIVVSA